jgi:hypothetical protein
MSYRKDAMTLTILSDQGVSVLTTACAEDDGLWLSPTDAEAATGWSYKPEGLCRGSVCIPVPPAARESFARDGAINIAAFWRRMGNPVAASDDGDIWVLGEGADARTRALESLEAPDFTLPDLLGRTNRLSDHAGKKVLLTTWASW